MIVDKFNADGKDYEVRLETTGDGLTIRVFHKGEPADGYSYSITLDTAYDYKFITSQDAVKDLISLAKNNIIEHKYENLITAIRGE